MDIKDNLDIIDEHNMQDVWMHEGLVYSGDTALINDQIHKDHRIPSLLGAAVLGLNNTATPSTTRTKFIWTDIDAQENNLNQKPTCYLIIGKPEVGDYHLGEAIAKKYNCIHFCPKNIVQDEILQGSLTGRCVDFNMKHNIPCTYSYIFDMLKQKLKSPAVHHRGYVISGFPMTTAYRNPFCMIKSMYSEESFYTAEEILNDIIYNLRRKKTKHPRQDDLGANNNIDSEEEEEYIEEEEEEEKKEELSEEDAEEQEVAAELPKFVLNSCSNVVFYVKPYYDTRQSISIEQLHEVFNVDLRPDIIIHITCPDADVITKKLHRFLSIKTGLWTVEPYNSKTETAVRWPAQYNISDYENPHVNYVFHPKYNVRTPINFKDEMINQLCNYRHYSLPYIEKKLMDYDPKQVIKLDGRTSTYQMMHQVSERLLLMHISPVLIPEPLYLIDPPEDFEEFWSSVAESQVIRGDDLSFKRCPSPWYNRCPVELKKRQSVIGKPKYAVAMFKHVYLMSSLPNFISFCRNPRPYLYLEYLEPTCRIIVTGTKSSGKTMISECLSWLFDTRVTSFNALLDNEKQKKYQVYAKTILSEIVPVIEDTRLLKWQQKEQHREASLKAWNQSMLKLLKKYPPLLTESLKYVVKESHEGIESEKKQIIHEVPEPDPVFLKKFNSLRERLSFLPILDSVDDCRTAIASGNLTQYAPFELANVTEKPSLPLLGDEDVTKAISEYITVNDLHKEIEPTTEEVMNEIIKLLSNVDIEQQVQTGFQEQYGKFIIDGFPSDPEYWDMLINAKLTPDYTISIMENREIDPNLLLHYLNIDKHIKNHHDILSLAHDPLILCKLQTKKIPIARDLDIKMVVHDIVYDSVSKVVDSKTEDKPEISTEMVAAFTESIEKFREDWDNIKLKLEDKMKCFIEIELENKTDVEVLDEALLKLRQCYYLPAETNEDEDVEEVDEAESAKPKDLLTYNDTQNLCETSIYCPYTYYKYGLLWEGKRDISLKYDNKVHYFAKEEFLELFRKDVTKYQAYNHPFKKLPALKICVVGCAGSGLSALSKRLAVELGLIHIHFADIINYYYMPRHYKNVGRKYENPFTDEPMEEEAVVEFQMDEENPNLLTDIFSNEKELRRIVYNYYERGQPILPVIMQKIITNLWFTEPFKSTGFVLDGYPRLPQDVEDLIHCNCIPDIVIEIESNAEIGVARIGPLMFNLWKSQYKEAKAAHKIVIETQQNLWMSYIVKKTVIKLILEELLENCVGVEYPLKKESLAVESFVFDAHPTGSTNVDPKLFQIYNELIEQYPKPTDTREWEKPDDVRERIDSRIEAICETEYDNIQTFKELLTDNKINVVTIDGSKPFIKVLRRTISHLKHLRNRSQSFFEQTYIITSDIAELLLAQGYYFLSNFGRLCPVYVYENEQIIHNSYKIGRRLGNIFPIIHRSYIYFVCSKDNVIKFRKNPLKYIIGETINAFRPHPLGIAIIGAPKSGKSTLAAKLARRHNLLCISKGMAIRSVLENMPWTELGSRIFKNLHNGDIIDTNSVMNAIQTVSIDHRAVTYGFVLDGFPTVPYEAMLLAEIGLYPNLIFDITADKVRILENSQNEVHYDILKYVPPYSHTYIENKYTKWNEQAYKIRNWIRSDYQNIHSLDGHRSRWQCYQYVKKIILELTSEIHSYLTKVGTEVVPVKVMAISNVLFEKKMSVYKNLCPVCLRKNILKHSGYPVDKNGVMQYRNTFYWICEKHVDLVKKFPDYYLDDDLDIPELPAVVSIINPHNVYENGICIVTYAENLPAQLLQRGTHQFAAAYKSKTYLFCSELCHRKFLEKPMFYADITVFKESSSYPRLSLKKLPDLGYLEQTLGNILTEACCSVNAIRPKYPGLSVELSALLHIALYLKTHNERLPKDQIKFYRKALSMYENRSKLILDLGLRMRSMENPFISYPKCRHGTPKQSNPPDKSPSIKTSSIDSAQSMGEPSMRSDVSSSTGIKRSSVAAYQGGDDDDISKYYALLGPTSRVPVPDDRYDYLCEFHKPASKVPAFLNVVDIAGLVRGAAEGQGLGNAFLSHIKACDAIFNLCRAFDDEDVIHVDGDVNPVRDLETIGEELRLKDEEELMKNIEKLDRVVNRGNDKKLKPEYDTLQKVKTVLVDEKKHIRFGDWSAADIEVLNKYLFLTSKPALYLVNLSEKDYIRKKNKWLPKLKEWIDKNDPGSPLIPFSGALETKLVEMDAAERQAFLKENNLTSALDKIIVQGYKALQLEYFFTAGPDEVKAWTIQKGTKAPQAAGRIHTDFEKGFIMAEVMHFKDFKEEGTEAACKAAGKYRQQGRNYVVEDGDIIFFKFNAGAGLKDAKKK